MAGLLGALGFCLLAVHPAVATAPPAATLVGPAGTISTARPTYVWNAVPQADSYYLWVNDSAGPAKVTQWLGPGTAGCGAGTGTCTFTPATALAPGGARWWIQAWSVTGGYGPWSAPLDFTIAPPAATLVSPSGSISANRSTYIWNAVPQADSYHLWVNDSSGAGKIAQWLGPGTAGCAAGTGTCSFAPSTALAPGAARWWIQTWSVTLGYGPWSAPLDFTVPSVPAGPTGRFRLPTRGLYVQFERRGWPTEYWSGQVIQNFNTFDPVVGSTVAAEVGLQLDKLREMGVNTITFELRTADGGTGPFVPPACPIPSVLGFNWPQPTSTELTNLRAFFDLVQSKGMRVLLRLVNTHMEEQPPTNSQTWLGAILPVVKDHPALDLVLFEGNTHLVDTNGDGIPDACGIPAEPPLWLGPTAKPAQYVKWAIGYAMSLGLPARKLSAEAIVGDFFVESQPPAGPDATDGHLWSPIAVLKQIFDDLGIPNDQRTYALSFYEHRKCATARNLPCVDTDPHSWADQTLQWVFTTIGTLNGARVVAPEMGASVPVEAAWPTRRASESLVFLMETYGVDGGSFWRWVSSTNAEDADPTLADPVKRRGVAFTYTTVQKEILDFGGFHLPPIPNGSFEAGVAVPDNWTIGGNGTGLRYFLAGEPGQPEVPSRGSYTLRLATGNGTNDAISATSTSIPVSPNVMYATTANLRFGWSGDPNPGGDPANRPQVFVAIRYFDAAGAPSSVRALDVFRFFQEDSTQGFGTFPVQYTTPSDAQSVRIEVGAARNALPTSITLDADNLR